MITVHFVLDREHPRHYFVFTRSIDLVGTVRKSTDPIRQSHAWGWASVPWGHYRNGQTCDGGYATRRAAGIAVASRVLGVDESEIQFE